MSKDVELENIALVAFPNDREARRQYMERIQAHTAKKVAEAEAAILRKLRHAVDDEIDAGIPEDLAYRTGCMQMESDALAKLTSDSQEEAA